MKHPNLKDELIQVEGNSESFPFSSTFSNNKSRAGNSGGFMKTGANFPKESYHAEVFNHPHLSRKNGITALSG